MESQKKRKMLDIIETIEESHYNLAYEDIAHLKDTINANRTVDLRLGDIRRCVEDTLERVGGSPATEGIINIILVTSSQLMKQILQKIVEILELCDFGTFSTDVEVKLTTNIFYCVEILDSLVLFLKFVIKKSLFDINTVHDLPLVIATVLMDVFSHCKSSETLYSTYFQQIGSKITLMFKKCHELQVQYLALITENLYFDLKQDNHMDLMLQVLDLLIDIGEVVIVLDVKTMAEQWKGYSRLCEKYSQWLKDKDIHIKATTLLCGQIQDGLQSMINNEIQDPKNMTRCLKSNNFIMKLVIKLCEMFGGSIAGDSRHILQLVSSVQQYSSPQLIHMGLSKSIVEGIRSHITVGAEPLLLSMVQHVEFKQCFLDHINTQSESSNQLGDVLMIVSIMKTLLSSSEDVRDGWTSDSLDGNIICILLNVVPLCHSEFLKGLKFDSNDSKGGSVSLYDYMLYHCASLVVSCKDISRVEETMLALVLQDDLWGALFSMDLWMIIARYSSTELRFDQLNYLIEIYNDLKNENMFSQTPQKCYMTQLIQNLFTLLSNKLVAKLVDKFPIPKYPHVWTAIGLDQLPSEYKGNVENVIIAANSALNAVLSASHVEEFEYYKMLDYLNLIATIQEDTFNSLSPNIRTELIDNISEAWRRLTFREELRDLLSDKESSVENSHWIDVYFMSLCDVSCNLLQMFSNEQLIMILQVISTFISKTQSCNKISTLNILKSITHLKINNTNSMGNNIIHCIAKLFGYLLQDVSPVVRVQSLEVFSYLATNTQNETIVSETVKGNGALKEEVTNFFLKKVDTKNFNFICSCNKFTHKCINVSLPNSPSPDFDIGNVEDLFEDSDSFIDTPNKRMKIDASVENDVIMSTLNKMTEDVNGLLKYKNIISKSEEFKIKLNNICETLTNLTNN